MKGCSWGDWMIRTIILVLVRIRNRRIYHLVKEEGRRIVANWRYPFAQRMLRFRFRLLVRIWTVLRCTRDYRSEMG